MNELLQNTLADVIQQLANFFGTTIDAVSANLPEWLTKLAWYNFSTHIILSVSLGILLAFCIVAIVDSFKFMVLDEDEIPFFKHVLWTSIPVCFLIVLNKIMPILIAPELAGAQVLIKMLNGGG